MLSVDGLLIGATRGLAREDAEHMSAIAAGFQSLARGGTVEVDYLNGEIVLLGRLHGVPTPVNELLQRTANELARARRPPGSLDAAELLRRVG